MSDILTHSRMACFRSCPRKHYLRYELGLTSVVEGSPRRIGSAFHAALDAGDKGQEVTVETLGLEDEYEIVTVAAMLAGHGRYLESDTSDITPVASELEFDLPLINPETGKPTPIWRFCGKIDRIVRLADGRLALMEYKTTSRDFSPGAEYWQNLHLDQQLSIYIIAARELGYDVRTVLYDVTRRPQLKPYKATPTEARKYTKDGRLYANQRDQDETANDFHARLVADINERPEHYYARIEIARLDQDIEDCRAELWQQQQSIREAQRSARWYRNPNNCYGMFPCDYLPICLNRDLETRTPQGFERVRDVHPELSAATSEG